MVIPRLISSFFVLLLLASPVYADRAAPGNAGQRPNSRDRIDRDNWDHDGSVTNYYPPGVQNSELLEEAEAAREKTRQREDAARRKARDTQMDPRGDFFNSDQNPTKMFKD